MSEIAIIGAGAWGTALAIALGRRGTHRVRMWAHEKEVRESINQRHSNDLFLPGHKLPESVTATGHYQEAVRGSWSV
jgi:glycerol-3-phosphate dehydrogenase (NAD(P)+)